MNERIEAVISGKVQMVMYRDFVQRKASALGLTGEVQNLPNGTVRVVAEGSRAKLEELIRKLHKGSVLARVKDVSVEWNAVTNEFSSFKIQYAKADATENQIVPKAIGIIMDGNRRWAREHGKQILEGHRTGLEKAKEILVCAQDAGVQEVILYAFSTENWKRAEEEVGHLMGLIEFAFGNWIEEIVQRDTRVRCVGEISKLPESAQQRIRAVEEKTKEGKNGTLILALSYGGRAEIVAAANKLLMEGKSNITEEDIKNSLWTSEFLDPDLIIRTGGDHRLSNFLLWQSAYSELFFTKTLWPDFSKEEFENILKEFSSRERRHGK